MRIVLVFISIFMGLALQACYLNAKIDSLAATTGSSEPGKINPVSIQVSSTEIILQEQDADILYNSEIILTLNQKYIKPIIVNLTLADIYAQSTVDYSISEVSFVIAPGELSKSIPVLIKGDVLGEGSETFKIQISLSEAEVTLSANEVLVSILDNDPIVLQVASLYPNSGSNFLAYVENVRAVPLTQLADDPCTYLATKKYDDCIDGGYHRKVIATGEHSCTNLSMEDNLGIFDWVCSSTADPVFFYSKDMKTGKGLKDILNTSSFKDNFVTLKKSSVSIASSAPAVWWGNTISPITLNTVAGSARINLSSSGTIYTINTSGVSSGITLNSKVGLVILSGSLTSTNPSTGDCDSSSVGTQPCLIYLDTGSDLSRVEGSFVGTSNLTGVLQFGGTFGSDISLITINNTTVKGVGSGVGIYSSAGYTPGITVSNVNVSNFNTNIYFSSAGRNKLLKNITISNATGSGFTDSSNGWYSKYINITLVNNGSTGFSSVPWNSVLQNVVISNNGSNGLNDFSAASIFLNIMVSGNNGSGILTQLNSGVLKNITTVNNVGTGVIINSGSGDSMISNFISSNNAKGIEVGEDNLKFSNLLVSNNTTGIEFVSGATDVTFKNKLVLGSNATNCLYTSAGANPGLMGADCDNQGLSSATKTLGASAVGYFQGKVLSETVNTHVTALSVASGITDWIGFQNPFRLWGVEAAGDVLLGSKGKCSGAASCRVWDYRLLNTATEAYNVNGVFVNGTTCPASVQGDVTDLYSGIPHLVNALEIMFDRKGNDNGLCESNEECIYSPHIGYFQGEGDYTNNTCIFVNGSGSNPVVGVKMYSYPNP